MTRIHTTFRAAAGNPWPFRYRIAGAGRRVAKAALVVAVAAAMLNVAAGPAAASARPHKPAWTSVHLYGPPARAVVKWPRVYRAGAYRVFRNGHLVARHLRRNHYVDRHVRRGKRYRYAVTACNPWGCSWKSRRAAVRTPSAPPPPPQGVEAAWRATGGIHVSWQASRAATK